MYIQANSVYVKMCHYMLASYLCPNYFQLQQAMKIQTTGSSILVQVDLSGRYYDPMARGEGCRPLGRVRAPQSGQAGLQAGYVV